MSAPVATPAPEPCATCFKPLALCICDRVEPLKSRTHVLVLQHPQELDQALGSARLAELSLPGRVVVRPGLSWASLSDAAGRELDAKDWGVLYLGSLKHPLTAAQLSQPLVLLDRQGAQRDPKRSPLQGIVVLDGTWSQAKTLWWRNAWLLKLNRVLLNPREPSAYGKLRKQSQRSHLSTIEAIAEALNALGENPAVKKQLQRLFRTLLQRARDADAAAAKGKPKKARDDQVF